MEYDLRVCVCITKGHKYVLDRGTWGFKKTQKSPKGSTYSQNIHNMLFSRHIWRLSNQFQPPPCYWVLDQIVPKEVNHYKSLYDETNKSNGGREGQCEWNIKKSGRERSYDWTQLMSDRGFGQQQAGHWFISRLLKERREGGHGGTGGERISEIICFHWFVFTT